MKSILAGVIFFGAILFSAVADEKGVVGGVLPGQAERQDLSMKKPAVLFLIRKVDPAFRAQLEKMGFAVYEQRPQDGDLTWDFLKQFNVLALSEWCKLDRRVDLTQPPDESTKYAIPAIQQFLEKGGGILANCSCAFAGTLPNEAAMQCTLLKEWGAKPTPQDVSDPSTTQTGGKYGWSYLYTDQIDSKSPVSDGVNGLWLGCGNYTTRLNPILFGPDWTVVIRGGKTAKSAKYKVGHPYYDAAAEADQEFDSLPPLFGIRQYKAGRIAALAMADATGYGAGNFHLVGGIQMEKGIGGKPSDYGRLIVNTLKWLAEPSLKNGELGGYQPNSADEKKNGERAASEVIAKKKLEWKDVGFPKNFKHIYRGIVGLSSKNGGGKSSVSEYAATAQKLALDFIVFLDPLEKLGPEGWEKLKAECKAATNEKLLVYPGMRYLDVNGNHLFVLGDFLSWPADYLTAEIRMKFRLPESYFFLSNNEPVLGVYKVSQNPNPLWDMRLYNSMAVMTYEGGKKIDECLGDYQYGAWNYLNLRPYSVDLIDSSDGMEQALKDRHMLNVIPANSLNDVKNEFFNGNRGRGYRHTADKYISNGPQITAWRMLNGTRVTGGDWWLKGSQRIRARIQVESAIPLKEVLIYNGSNVIRKFAPAGNSMSQDIEMTHDNQSGLTVVAEDTDGNRAISDDRVANDFLLYDFYCSDHVNSIPMSWVKAPNGDVVGQDYTCMVHGILCDSLLPGVNRQVLAPPGNYVDFSGIAGPSMPIMRVVAQEGEEGRKDSFIRKIDRIMTSPDALIKSSSIRYKCPANGPVGGGAWLNGWLQMPVPQPTELVDIDYQMFWEPYRFAGAATGLVEGIIKFKKDVTLKSPISLFMISQYHKVADGKYDHYMIRTPEKTYGGKVPIEGETAATFSGKFPFGSYVSLFPAVYGSSTLFSMNDNLSYSLNAGRDTNQAEIMIGQDSVGKSVKAGTEWHFKILGLRGISAQSPDNREAEDFMDYFFGLSGRKGYEIQVKCGRVKESVFPIELESSNGCFQGQVQSKRDPGIYLPLKVEGLGCPWSVVMYDCEKSRLRILGVQNGNAYCALDLGDVKNGFAIGYPLTAENTELAITLIDDGSDCYQAELYNPTDKEIKTTVQSAPWCVNLIKIPAQTVTVPAMSSIIVK